MNKLKMDKEFIVQLLVQASTPISTLVKLKSLEDIYARCYVCIMEPESYKEAASDDVKSRS